MKTMKVKNENEGDEKNGNWTRKKNKGTNNIGEVEYKKGGDEVEYKTKLLERKKIKGNAKNGNKARAQNRLSEYCNVHKKPPV
jgi:hypothetical protein